MVEHGANINSQMDNNHPSTPRWTALDAAVSQNDNKAVKFLLGNHADPNLSFDLPNNNYAWRATPLVSAVCARPRP